MSPSARRSSLNDFVIVRLGLNPLDAIAKPAKLATHLAERTRGGVPYAVIHHPPSQGSKRFPRVPKTREAAPR